ncbi:MAG: hypothetical protein ACRDGS_10660 [Chloroflexota bacterium]
MNTEDLVLLGRHVRLEPLEYRQVSGLAAASAGDPSLYQWSPVPRGEAAEWPDVKRRLGQLIDRG